MNRLSMKFKVANNNVPLQLSSSGFRRMNHSNNNQLQPQNPIAYYSYSTAVKYHSYHSNITSSNTCNMKLDRIDTSTTTNTASPFSTLIQSLQRTTTTKTTTTSIPKYFIVQQRPYHIRFSSSSSSSNNNNNSQPIVTITKTEANTTIDIGSNNNNTSTVSSSAPQPLIGEARIKAIQQLNSIIHHDNSSNDDGISSTNTTPKQISPFQWEEDSTGRNAIHKTYYFINFQQAFDYMKEIAIIAETMNHHPEWKNIYNIVEVTLCTHDCNNISLLDIQLAEHMDRIYLKYTSNHPK